MADVKLKICGVTTIQEAEALKNTKISYIGLNFVPSSSRCITLEAALGLAAVFKNTPIQTVALFQDQSLDTVNDYARQLNVDYVQLHGGETPEYARAVEAPVIKAIAVDPTASAAELAAYIKDYPAEYFVLDRHEQGRGDIVGTGIAKQVVDSAPDKVCLAGGLNPDNLAAILSEVHPYAIDISSGVRTEGVVDIAKVRRCLEIIAAECASRP